MSPLKGAIHFAKMLRMFLQGGVFTCSRQWRSCCAKSLLFSSPRRRSELSRSVSGCLFASSSARFSLMCRARSCLLSSLFISEQVLHICVPIAQAYIVKNTAAYYEQCNLVDCCELHVPQLPKSLFKQAKWIFNHDPCWGMAVVVCGFVCSHVAVVSVRCKQVFPDGVCSVPEDVVPVDFAKHRQILLHRRQLQDSCVMNFAWGARENVLKSPVWVANFLRCDRHLVVPIYVSRPDFVDWAAHRDVGAINAPNDVWKSCKLQRENVCKCRLIRGIHIAITVW